MDKLTISLLPHQWDVVFNALYARPYGEVAQLIQVMAQQLQAPAGPTAAAQEG